MRHPNWSLIFLGEKTNSENLWKSLRIASKKVTTTKANPGKSSRVLRVKRNFFIFFIFPKFLHLSWFFFMFLFFLYILHFLHVSLFFFILLHFYSFLYFFFFFLFLSLSNACGFKHKYQSLTKDVSTAVGAPWRCGVLTK